MDYAARARRYAEDVVSGKVLACRWVRLAAERHLSNLRDQDDPDFPFRFDEAKANEVCGFIELLPHVKGAWARRAERIKLEDWQCFAVAVPFGWVKKSNGLRRFRRVYFEVPRKNAKSTLTAAIGLYMLTMDGEAGAEVYSGAGSEKQAWEVFGPARRMALATPELIDAYGIQVNAKSITIPDSGSKFEPVIGKPGDGASPSFSITDEYHEHATDEQYDTMVTGMGSREQPIAWVITTAGTDIAGPCYALRKEVIDMLEGSIPDDTLFGVIYSIDADTDWTTEEALRMANPNYGVSVYPEYLLEQQRVGINNLRRRPTIRTKHFNIWEQSRNPWMDMDDWRRCGDATLTPERFRGKPAWIGLDLSSKLDLSASPIVFREEIDGLMHYYVFPRIYVPEDRASLPENRHYLEWSKGGYLTLTDGNVIDYQLIEADIRADAGGYAVQAVAFDPFGATDMTNRLAADGINVVEIPQNVKHLSEPMKEVEALVKSGRLHHPANPAFDWCVSNVKAKEDANENVYPRKENAEAKIDPVTAMLNAMAAARLTPLDSEPLVMMLSF